MASSSLRARSGGCTDCDNSQAYPPDYQSPDKIIRFVSSRVPVRRHVHIHCNCNTDPLARRGVLEPRVRPHRPPTICLLCLLNDHTPTNSIKVPRARRCVAKKLIIPRDPILEDPIFARFCGGCSGLMRRAPVEIVGATQGTPYIVMRRLADLPLTLSGPRHPSRRFFFFFSSIFTSN